MWQVTQACFAHRDARELLMPCCAVLCCAVLQALMLMIKEQVHGSAAATMRGIEALLQKTQPMGQQLPVHKLAVKVVTA